MRTLFVDADACPVKPEIYRVARRVRWQVVIVANQWIETPRLDFIRAEIVGAEPDAADDYIAEHASEGDVVITTDIPLAARALEGGARVIGPKGLERTASSIGGALASRALAQDLREAGIMTGGPAPMTQKDRSRFLNKLDQVIVAIERSLGPR